MSPVGKTATSSPTAKRRPVSVQATTPSIAGPRDQPPPVRRRREMQRWRRRARMIHLFRRALPATIAAILMLLTGWVVIRGVLTRLTDARDGAASIHMTNARFFGRDGDGHPYVLAAGGAARDDADFQRIQLRDAMLSLNADMPVHTQISATRGVYRENDRILRLSGQVTFRDGAGDLFITEQAIVDTINGVITGPSKIRGSGPTGVIAADAFEIFDRGQRMVFRGNVHSRLKQG